MNIEQLLRDEKETVLHDYPRADLLKEMVQQLASTNPTIRDRYVYSTFVEWISYDTITEEEMALLFRYVLEEQMLTRSLGEEKTDDVFARSYSALLMATLIAKDAMRPFLEKRQLELLFENVGYYLDRERDVRYEVGDKGLAHSVAHFADLNRVAIQHPSYSMVHSARTLQAIANNCWKGDVWTNDEDERFVSVILALVDQQIEEEMLIEWVEQMSERLSFYIQREGYTSVYLHARTMTLQLMKTLYFGLKVRHVMPKVQYVLSLEIGRHLSI